MSDDPFQPIEGGASPAKGTEERPTWSPVLPVPGDATAPPAEHYRHGRPAATWRYIDGGGRLLHLVTRFDVKPGDKQVLPLTFCLSSDGRRAWRWQAAPAPRPLYGLDRLAARPSAPVIVSEGEKAADAAGRLLPSHVSVTSSGGSKAAGKTHWAPLAGRDVVIWPDADEPGAAYAGAVAAALDKAGARSVATITPPAGVTAGWDAADAERDGWTMARAAELVDTASAPAKGGASRERRVPQRDTLFSLTEFCEPWHDPMGEPFLTIPINGHREHWATRSKQTKNWLASEFYRVGGHVLGNQALEDGLRVLEARACNEGPEYTAWRRVGRVGDRLYLDLGDRTWRAVEIGPEGWRVVSNPPAKFLRSAAMKPLPEPEGGSMIEELRGFINVASEEDFRLYVAWLVAALRETGPFPILIVNGEQGSGKSNLSRIARALVDPAIGEIRAMPRDIRELVVAANNSWTLAFDNLSSVPGDVSDAFCRLSTGGGFAARMLHTDRDEAVFDVMRPLILNGIPLLAERPDLADRAITLHLPAIPESARRSEEEFWAEFHAAKSRILGALLDAVSAALRNIASTRLPAAPRMADFARWATAAEPGLGWEQGSFLAAYGANRRDVSESAFEANVFAVALRGFILAEHPHGWHGTATELLAAINDRTPESTRRLRGWPAKPQSVGNEIVRVSPLLRGKGLIIERRHSGDRLISIVPIAG